MPWKSGKRARLPQQGLAGALGCAGSARMATERPSGDKLFMGLLLKVSETGMIAIVQTMLNL
jgi:hypothetical protein